MYAEIFLRLEPLGPERVAAAAREAGHQARVVDLQDAGRHQPQATSTCPPRSGALRVLGGNLARGRTSVRCRTGWTSVTAAG